MQWVIEKWVKEFRKGRKKMAVLSLPSVRDMYGHELIKERSRIVDVGYRVDILTYMCYQLLVD